MKKFFLLFSVRKIHILGERRSFAFSVQMKLKQAFSLWSFLITTYLHTRMNKKQSNSDPLSSCLKENEAGDITHTREILSGAYFMEKGVSEN